MENSLMEIVDSLKQKSPSNKKEVVAEVRDLIQFSRSDIMGLTLQKATQLLTGLLEDERIKELSRAGIHVTLAELSKPAARKERADKGVPRKERIHPEPDGVSQVNDEYVGPWETEEEAVA